MQTPQLNRLCEITAQLGRPIDKGTVGGGQSRIVPIIGGTVEGDRLSGRILNLGADWQTLFQAGYSELDTRYVIETHDGAIIDIRNFGFRHGPADVMAKLAAGEVVDPALYYMRTLPRFQTGDSRYHWLNHTVFVGTGERRADSVHIGIFEVL